MSVQFERFPLPDGSYGLIEPISGVQSALISREIEGHVVWGQAFGHESRAAEIIDRVKANMTANPDGFVSAWHNGVEDSWANHDCPVLHRTPRGVRS